MSGSEKYVNHGFRFWRLEQTTFFKGYRGRRVPDILHEIDESLADIVLLWLILIMTMIRIQEFQFSVLLHFYWGGSKLKKKKKFGWSLLTVSRIIINCKIIKSQVSHLYFSHHLNTLYYLNLFLFFFFNFNGSNVHKIVRHIFVLSRLARFFFPSGFVVMPN